MLFPMLLSVLVGLGIPIEQYQYHSTEIMRKMLCVIPRENGHLLECETYNVMGDVYREVDCVQESCECAFEATSFDQTCVYNNTKSFSRKCFGFTRTCILYNNAYDVNATCQDWYDHCVVVSEPLATRYAVGWPEYNPPMCGPGFRAAKDGCNSTSNRCEGNVTIKVKYEHQTELSCYVTCGHEETHCTNYTKGCNDTRTSWYRPDVVSRTEEDCDVITNKCDAIRYIVRLDDDLKYKARSHHISHDSPGQEVVMTRYDCKATKNLTESINTCKKQLSRNMKYKTECLLYGLQLMQYLYEGVFAGNRTISDVVSYIDYQWDKMVRKLCKLNCYRVLTRELRFCLDDLPIQSVLPGMTTAQFEMLLFAGEKLLCSSLRADSESTCVLLLDQGNAHTSEVIRNTSLFCDAEYAQWKRGEMMTCSEQCKTHMIEEVLPKHSTTPGCCLGDLRIFEEESSPWFEVMSPTCFKNNYLLNVVDACQLNDNMISCAETELMNPAVIFVIAILGVFSVALVSGVIAFIAVFYRQMEHEGYEKSFLYNMIT